LAGHAIATHITVIGWLIGHNNIVTPRQYSYLITFTLMSLSLRLVVTGYAIAIINVLVIGWPCHAGVRRNGAMHWSLRRHSCCRWPLVGHCHYH